MGSTTGNGELEKKEPHYVSTDRGLKENAAEDGLARDKGILFQPQLWIFAMVLYAQPRVMPLKRRSHRMNDWWQILERRQSGHRGSDAPPPTDLVHRHVLGDSMFSILPCHS